MFAKEPHIKPLSNLKNSDRKKLQGSIQKQLCQDYQLPTATIKQTNFQLNNMSGSIYTDENNKPIWFKTKFEDTLYPSIFTLWTSQMQLLPIILTHDFVIEEHILGGAHLMLPGTIPPFPQEMKKGTIVGICSSKQPNLIKAVGVSQMNLCDISYVIGTKGIAVKVVHYLDDGLFKAFKLELKEPATNQPESVTEANVDLTEDNQEASLIIEQEINNDKPNGKDDAVDEITEEMDQLTVEDIDHMLIRAVKYTIKFDTKVELPIVASTFISNHVMKNLPATDTNIVNIKKSSWKKATKFLKYLEDQGFLKLKGKNDSCTVISVNKDHKELADMEAYQTSSKKTTSISASKKQPTLSYFANSLFKPINLGRDFINETNDHPMQAYFTQQEIKTFLDQYISEHNLIDPKNKSLVILDDRLFNMCNQSTQNGGILTISRAVIMAGTFLTKNFNEYYQIYDPKGEPLHKSPIKGSVPKIEIITETKIGRKIITRISNFDSYKIDAEEFAQALRKKCSGSTTIGETTKNPITTEVQVQGPHGPTAISILNDYGIPTKWITFVNKLKPKKKKVH